MFKTRQELHPKLRRNFRKLKGGIKFKFDNSFGAKQTGKLLAFRMTL